MEEIMKGDITENVASDSTSIADEKNGSDMQPKSRQRITGSLRTCINILKVYIGAGILGLPHAFSQTGIVASVLLMLLLSFITIHTIRMLVQSRIEISKKDPNIVTFGQLCSAAFDKYGRAFVIAVDGLVVFTQLGFCCSYLIFLGQNMALLLDNKVDWRYMTLAWAVVLTFMSWIRTLKKLAPFATLALVCLLSSIVAIIVGSVTALVRTLSKGLDLELVHLNWKDIPNMLSVGTFSFEGIGFILPAYTVAKRPEKFFLYINICISVVSFFYIFFGAMCYIGFGSASDPIILKSLLNYFEGENSWKIVTIAINVFLLVAIGFSYPLQFFVAMDILEEVMLKPETTKKDYWLKNNFRMFFVFLTGLVSVVVPRFDEILGFIGSLGSSPLMYICPSLIYLSVFWKGGLKWYNKVLPIFYIIFGVMVLVSGTITNLIKLIDSYE